jgi:hypothetical protein
MRDFNKDKIPFVARLKENRKFIEKENQITDNQNTDLGESVLQESQFLKRKEISITVKN